MKFGLSISKIFSGSNHVDVGRLRKEIKKNKGKRLSANLSKMREYKAEMKQTELDDAISLAEDFDRPDRSLLYAIYRNVSKEPHLLSQTRNSWLSIAKQPYAMFRKGTNEIDERATDLLRRPWFERYREIFHITKYWSHSLVEFQQMRTSEVEGVELEFDKIKVIPRKHVIPEEGLLIFDQSIRRGIPFREDPFDFWFMEIGDPDNLGLYEICAREVIWKNYSRTDWSRRSEKFGMPMMAIKTASEDKGELAEKQEMAQNFGSNLWVILDEDDEVDIKESNKADGHLIYKDKVEYCDKMLSKLANGQTGTSDEKAFVGGAKVHKDIYDDHALANMRSETYHVNFELRQFCIKHGYPFEGLEYRYLEVKNDDEEKEAGGNEKDNSQGLNANFTKPPVAELAGGGTLSDMVNGLYNHNPDCCGTPDARDDDDDDDFKSVGDASNKASDRVYNKKIKAGQADRELWRATVGELTNATTDGYGKRFGGVKYGSPDHVILTQMRHNAQVFAAFKNHHNTNELVKALVDENGKPRTFSQFKKAAGLINSKYNKNWLRTEFNQATLTARNAQRWQKIEARREVFPHVEYVAIKDGRTSKLCKDLDGGVWAIDDDILNAIAPSNHWGCRSILRSTDRPIDRRQSGEEVPAVFKNNPGKSGEAFSKNHPYYITQKRYEKQAANFFGLLADMMISGKALKRNVGLLALVDAKLFNITTDNVSGGFLAVDINVSKGGVIDSGRAVSRKGQSVVIKDSDGYNAVIDETSRQITSPLDLAALRGAITGKHSRVLVNVIDSVKATDLANVISHQVKNTDVQSVWVLYKDRLHKFDRDQILKSSIVEILKS